MKRILLAFCLSIAMPEWVSCVHAQVNPSPNMDFPERLLTDLRDLPAQPLHFSSTQWMVTGGVAAATVFALTRDGMIQGDVQETRTDFFHALSAYSTPFGDYRYQYPLHAYLWSLGTVANSPLLQKSAADGMEASFLAAGLITPLITKISGRALPSYHENALEFHPFILKKGHESFPSGHTTEAFTMAAVLDANFRETFGYWQTPFLFALASGTGLSRIYDDKHYLSDVIVGGAIGSSIGYWVADRQWSPPSNLHIWPVPGGPIMVWEF